MREGLVEEMEVEKHRSVEEEPEAQQRYQAREPRNITLQERLERRTF